MLTDIQRKQLDDRNQARLNEPAECGKPGHIWGDMDEVDAVLR